MRALRTLLVLLTLISCSPLQGSRLPDYVKKYRKQHRAEHWIVTEQATRAGGCTAYAIGPHALMTAEHCDLKDVDEDGKPVKDASEVLLFVDPIETKPDFLTAFTAYKIVAKEFDGSDHMILLVSGPAFKDVIEYDPQPPRAGEQVFSWGNPAGIRDQFREGYAMGVLPKTEVPYRTGTQDCWLFDYRAIPGDSGSAVFDAKDGHLVTIVSYGINDGMFMGGFALHFTPDQILAATSYGG